MQHHKKVTQINNWSSMLASIFICSSLMIPNWFGNSQSLPKSLTYEHPILIQKNGLIPITFVPTCLEMTSGVLTTTVPFLLVHTYDTTSKEFKLGMWSDPETFHSGGNFIRRHQNKRKRFLSRNIGFI